jgi:hypothetical protein
VDQFGAPRYPELLLVAKSGSDSARLGPAIIAALTRGYELLKRNPEAALNDLIDQAPGIDRSSQLAQLRALTSARAFALGNVVATPRLERSSVERWRAWAMQSGLLGAG